MVFGVELRKATREMDFPQWKQKISPMVKALGSLDKATIIYLTNSLICSNFKDKGKEALDFKTAVDSLMGWLRSLRQSGPEGAKYQFVFCGSINLRKTLESIGLSKRINDLEAFTIPVMKRGDAHNSSEVYARNIS